MAQYRYKGKNRSGQKTSGVVEADTEEAAKKKLRLLGVQVTSLSSGGSDLDDWKPLHIDAKGNIHIQLTPPKVTEAELAVFTKQLSVMIDSGIPIIQALDMLSDQTDNEKMKKTLIKVRQNVEGGNDLSKAMAKFPEVFDRLYTSLIEAGSSAGQLDVMLKRLSIYIEKSTKLKRQLIGAMTYPAGVVAIAIVMSIVMLMFVVPMFAKNYIESGKSLPFLTQFVIDISNAFQKNFVYLVGLVALLSMAFRKWKQTETGQRKWDEILLNLPLFGTLIRKIAVARFSSTMSTLIASGISLMETLEVCGRASGNLVIQGALITIRNEVAAGKSLSMSMGKYPDLFPVMVSGMVAIGEASGRLDQMLQKVADFYEEEVDAAMAAMLKLIEPILFIVIGGVVGFILIAMYLPIFDLASTQSG